MCKLFSSLFFSPSQLLTHVYCSRCQFLGMSTRLQNVIDPPLAQTADS